MTPQQALRTPPAPRWAVVAAHVSFLSVLPSSLWRLAMALGVPVGYSDTVLREVYHSPGWGTVYMIGLCVLSEAAAFLALGLVRDWGLVFPRWIPLLGGRAVNRLAAVVPATVASVFLTALWGAQPLLMILGPSDETLSGTARVVMYCFYAPMLLWGPLLGAVTWSYARRTRHRRELIAAA